MEMLRLESNDGSIQYLIGSPIRAGATVVLWQFGQVGARTLQLLATIKLKGQSCLVLYDEAAVYKQDKQGRVDSGMARYYKLQIDGDWQAKLDRSLDYFTDDAGNIYSREPGDWGIEEAMRFWLVPNLLLRAIHQEPGLVQLLRGYGSSVSQ
jgi:hypothetical protein